MQIRTHAQLAHHNMHRFRASEKLVVPQYETLPPMGGRGGGGGGQIYLTTTTQTDSWPDLQPVVFRFGAEVACYPGGTEDSIRVVGELGLQILCCVCSVLLR